MVAWAGSDSLLHSAADALPWLVVQGPASHASDRAWLGSNSMCLPGPGPTTHGSSIHALFLFAGADDAHTFEDANNFGAVHNFEDANNLVP